MADTWRRLLLLLLVLVVAVRYVHAQEVEESPEERLRREKLNKSYSKMTLPHRQNNQTTVVHFDIMPMAIWIEEDKQIVDVNAWIGLTWRDPRLTWDHKNYGGLDTLHLSSDEVWRPDLRLYNNAEMSETEHFGATNVFVQSNGRVLWVAPLTLRAPCPMDVTLWPYDTHICHLFLGSWTRHANQVDLIRPGNDTSVQPGWFMPYSAVWQYVEGSLQTLRPKLHTPEPYIIVHLMLVVARISPMYAASVILPALSISLLTLVQFLLPLREPRRLLLGCTSLLLTLVYLLYLDTVIPVTSHAMPKIGKFFGQSLVVVVVSVAVNCALLRLTDSRHPGITTSPPPALKTLLTGPLATVLCLRQYTNKVGMSGGEADDGEVLEAARPADYGHEWLLVAATLDRLAAITFVACFFITLVAYVAPVV